MASLRHLYFLLVARVQSSSSSSTTSTTSLIFSFRNSTPDSTVTSGIRTSGSPSGPPLHSLLTVIDPAPFMPAPLCDAVGVTVPLVCVPAPFAAIVSLDVELAFGFGIFARRSTSAISSGKVSQFPLRRSSRASARTRSVQPVRARESERREDSSGMEDVSRKWAIRASWVVLGRVGVVAEREIGRGMVRGSEEGMAGGYALSLGGVRRYYW